MPTLALVNSLLFQNVENPEKDAPPVRTLGTVGWIASGILVGGGFLVSEEFVWQLPEFMGGESAPTGETVKELGSTKWPYVFGVLASIILGVFSFYSPSHPSPLKR